MFRIENIVKGKIIRIVSEKTLEVCDDYGKHAFAHLATIAFPPTAFPKGRGVLLTPTYDKAESKSYNVIALQDNEQYLTCDINTVINGVMGMIEDKFLPELADYEIYKTGTDLKNNIMYYYLKNSTDEIAILSVRVCTNRKDGVAMYPLARVDIDSILVKQAIQSQKEGKKNYFLCFTFDNVDYFQINKAVDPELASLIQKAEDVGVETIAYTIPNSYHDNVFDLMLGKRIDFRH